MYKRQILPDADTVIETDDHVIVFVPSRKQMPRVEKPVSYTHLPNVLFESLLLVSLTLLKAEGCLLYTSRCV